MNKNLTFLSVMIIIALISGNAVSQDKTNESPRWNIPPQSTRIYATGDYAPLPVDNYVHPNTATRVVKTPIGTFLVNPNFRVHPSAGTQSEVPIVVNPGDGNIIFGSANTWRGGSFFSTGNYITTNGGVNWFGSDTTVQSSGDPGPWIWGPGGTFGGRLGISYITTSFQMGASFSTNNGITWAANVTFPGSTTLSDKNLSAVDDQTASPFFGRAYTVWTEFSGSFVNRIVVSFTTNGGVSWSTEAPVSPPPASGHHCQGCDVVVGTGGVVYVVWAHCTTNGQNSTEDNLGFAKSTDGGVTWPGANNNVSDMNGIRASNLFNGIRANGFPRIAIDKTGGSRNGWIYVVAGEKNFAPALDNSDVVLQRSTDGGTTWSRIRVNQDAAGKLNYMPAVNVDATGGVNVNYYDQRNTSTDSAEIYLSRSLDGGTSWTDIEVSDHHFKPKPISGLAGGYQGDYIGITSGNNRLFPYWAEDITGIYQAWISIINLGPPSQHDISCGPFLSLPGQFIKNTPYDIKTKVTNQGTANETGVPIKFFINGTLTATTNINLNSGASDLVSNSWTPAVEGFYTLMYASALANDTNRLNDTVRTTVQVLPSAPPINTSEYCRNGLNINIPDTTTIKDSIVVNVPNALTVLDVNVKIDTVIHTFDEDLSFVLKHIGGSVSLINLRGAAGHNFIGTNLNDSATIPISSGSAPFTGTFIPEAPLSALNGLNTNGSWILEITDNAPFDTGSLKAWCISLVYYTITGGIQTVTIPNYYSLSQNYPNPFNPVTKITYTLPKSGNVELKVYDILGREVATLVNEVKQAGIYDINFNATNLASGIYFYKIKAGDFSAIKKMVLVK
jgi:Secretion system C-terminal sorting domain/CARDB/BNR repeat-like domain